jgi:hypothetical protein
MIDCRNCRHYVETWRTVEIGSSVKRIFINCTCSATFGVIRTVTRESCPDYEASDNCKLEEWLDGISEKG